MNAHPIRRQHNPSLFRGFLAGLWYAVVSALAFVGLTAMVVGAAALQVGWRPSLQSLIALRPDRAFQVSANSGDVAVPTLFAIDAHQTPTTRVIYMNREGGTLTAGGSDDASRNVSSVVSGAGLERYEIPGFRGTATRWDDIMTCVRGQFANYDVQIVDQRPVDGAYLMVMVGGQPGALAAASGTKNTRGTRITGLAPLGSRPIENAVVYAFSREMREATTNVCETVAQEIGHAYGLDHVLDCRDPMTHLARCGRRSFQDRYTQCGEHEARSCFNGQPGQNSYQYLLDLLGPSVEVGEP